MKFFILALLTLALPLPVAAEEEHIHASPYAGEQRRDIKSLSAEDIVELRNGGGWDLAKAAELNGMPGPSHVLKMKHALGLTTDQETAARRLFDEMRDEAFAGGRELVARETALDTAFRTGTIDQGHLLALLRRIETSRTNLRYVHLAAHLRMIQVLNGDQVKRYNELRGYAQ